MRHLHKCQMVQLFKPYFDQSLIDRARAAGLRVNVFWSDDPDEAKRFLDMGTSAMDDSTALKRPLIFQKEGFGARAVCYDTYTYEL